MEASDKLSLTTEPPSDPINEWREISFVGLVLAASYGNVSNNQKPIIDPARTRVQLGTVEVSPGYL